MLELNNSNTVHVVGEGNDTSALTGLAAFEAFTQNHAERRSTPVKRSPAKIIGNYRVLEESRARSNGRHDPTEIQSADA